MNTRTTDEIDNEKRRKPRPDLVPARAILAAARAMAYGAEKHGLGQSGRGTYRDPGLDQSELATHIASFERHWLKFRQAVQEKTPDQDPETGLSHLDHAMAQLSLCVDLWENPVEIDE